MLLPQKLISPPC